MKQIGGAQKLASSLASILSGTYSVTIASFDPPGTEPCQNLDVTFQPIGKTSLRLRLLRPLDYLNHRSSLRSAKRRLCPDIVISILWRADLINAICRSDREISISLLVINIIGNKTNRMLEKFPLIGRLVYNSLSRVYGISPEICREFTDIFQIDQSRMGLFRVPTGETVQINSFNNSNSLAFCGRMAHEKNIPVLLGIFRNFVHKNPGYQLHLVGDGPLLSSMIELAKSLELTVSTQYCDHSDVIFFGSQERPEEYIMNASALLLPSIHEGLPLVLILAAKLGLPLLASDCHGGGPRYLFTEALPYLKNRLAVHDPLSYLLPIPSNSDKQTINVWVSAIEETVRESARRADMKSISHAIAKYHSYSEVRNDWLLLLDTLLKE